MTDEFKTDVTIENRGEIEAEFELTPNNSPFGQMFKFNVEQGVLGVSEKIPFKITFCFTKQLFLEAKTKLFESDRDRSRESFISFLLDVYLLFVKGRRT